MGGIGGGPADRLSADRPLEVRRTFGRHGSGHQSAFGRTSTTVDPCPMVGRVSVDVRSTVGQQTFGRWSTRCVAPKYTSSETLNYLWDFEKKSTPSASSSSQLSSSALLRSSNWFDTRAGCNLFLTARVQWFSSFLSCFSFTERSKATSHAPPCSFALASTIQQVYAQRLLTFSCVCLPACHERPCHYVGEDVPGNRRRVQRAEMCGLF